MVEKPLYRHGDKSHHTTIWYWNAGSVEPKREAQAMLLEGSGPDAKAEVSRGRQESEGEWQLEEWQMARW